MEYVSNNEIVLNVGFDATSGLDLGNEVIRFKARFGGAARDIMVPVDHVVAIYARENGQGMAFPAPDAATAAAAEEPVAALPAAEMRPATPLRGLRLAPTAPESEEEEATPAADSPDDDGDGPSPSGSRPSLKRIK